MAKKKDNIIEDSVEALQEKLDKLREEVRAMRFNTQGAKNKNVKLMSSLKKQIAQVMTKLTAIKKSIKNN